jgi:hypothetical protein
MERTWTKRGKMTIEDKAVVGVLAEQNPAAGRIFVTGEVFEESLGSIAANLLYAANDTLTEPLFVQTRQGTVQMARFDPEAAWPHIRPDLLERLVFEEGQRFNVEVRLDEWDFYSSLVLTTRERWAGVWRVPIAGQEDLDSFYHAMYWSCLFLLDKPGYMAVPVSQHFALPDAVEFTQSGQFRQLPGAEQEELLAMRSRYGEVRGITNSELNFLLRLHERA